MLRSFESIHGASARPSFNQRYTFKTRVAKGLSLHLLYFWLSLIHLCRFCLRGLIHWSYNAAAVDPEMMGQVINQKFSLEVMKRQGPSASWELLWQQLALDALLYSLDS